MNNRNSSMNRGRYQGVPKQETENSHSTENTFPIMFMNHIKEPSRASGLALPYIKRDLYSSRATEPKLKEDARDILEKYYEKDLRPFLRKPANPRLSVELSGNPNN